MLDFCLHSLCFCKLPVQFIIFCNLIFFVFFFPVDRKLQKINLSSFWTNVSKHQIFKTDFGLCGDFSVCNYLIKMAIMKKNLIHVFYL